MLIIVADMHIGNSDSDRNRFRAFLKCVSATPHDICFAGDILELWLGIAGFEMPLQAEFIDWCRREISRRSVYFIEGNHEFFVCRRYGHEFTQASPEALSIGNISVFHGDNLPGQNASHRFFRWLTKSVLSYYVFRLCPGRRAIVRAIKRKFERKSLGRMNFLPVQALEGARTEIGKKTNPPKAVFLGHFHEFFFSAEKTDSEQAIPLCVLPAWRDTEQVALVDPKDGAFELVKLT